MRFQNPTILDMQTKVFGIPVGKWDEMFSGGMEETLQDIKRRNMKDNKITDEWQQILDNYNCPVDSKKLTNYAIFKAFRDIQKFNKIMKTFEGNLVDKLDLYNSLGYEELCETIYAVEANNSVEALDGVLDEFIIIVGKMLILEEAGFNVAEGLKRVNKNNMSKLIPVGEAVHYNPEFTKELNEEYQVYVLKDSNGKTRKPSNFVSVDLSDCVPEGFFGEQV
jgi:hypothetical protein